MVAIETRYHGPTNYKGSRISVRRMDDEKRPERRFYSYPHELNSDDGHKWAANQWLREKGWNDKAWIGGGTSRGWVFVVDDHTYSPIIAREIRNDGSIIEKES
jgi:hypothetical protein